jgi:hypothetical protein
MVKSGTGHDRCPSRFPEPIRRPGATLRWRFRNYKSRFWFQGGVKKIIRSDFDRTAGALRPRRQGRLDGSRLRRELFAGPAHGEVQSVFRLFPKGVLGLRAPSNVPRSAAMA